MGRISNAVFTKEFREEALRMVIDGKLSVPEVAGRLSMSKGTLAYWIKLLREGKLVVTRRINEEAACLARLERELAQVKMERDFLKKAAAYFAKIESR
jgi:transposase